MDKEIARETDGNENVRQDKIYWHDAFYAALQLELHDYIDALIFEDERQLSKEALKMDVLVIKKAKDVQIDKNIGRIFKGHNIFEYKSEKDNLSIWDYNKVVGYAMLYSAFEEVPTEDITVSFVVTPKPVKLLDHLQSERSFTVDDTGSGIYYVQGDTFPIQIIESKRLTSVENVFLKSLRSSLTPKDMEYMLEEYGHYRPLDKVGIYLSRVIDANNLIFKEVLSMVSARTREIITEAIEENGLADMFIEKGIEKGEEKKARDAAIEMLKDGFSHDKIARYVKMPVDWVRKLSN